MTMHPARLSFLASRHALCRAVLSVDAQLDGNYLTLACGHDACAAPHFDCSKTKTWQCTPCGEEYVRNAPQYAKEFAS
jgi:hypothetical protein